MKERKCPGMTLQETAMRQDVALFGLNSVGAVRLGGVRKPKAVVKLSPRRLLRCQQSRVLLIRLRRSLG